MMLITFGIYLYMYIFMKNVQEMYSLFKLFVWYIFKTAAMKKSHYGFKAYTCPNILIPLAKWTIYASILK